MLGAAAFLFLGLLGSFFVASAAKHGKVESDLATTLVEKTPPQTAP